MSYILDALRRADAERERSRGNVPGLHAQQLPPGAPRDTRTRAPRQWLWLAGGLASLLVAALAWQWLAHDGAPAAPTELSRAAQGTVTPPPVVPAPPPAAMAPQMPTGAAPAPAPTPPANPTPAPTALAAPPPSEKPTPPTRALPAPTPRKPPATELAGTRPEAATAKPAVAAGSGAGAPPRVMSRNELPEDVQRGLPTLTVGGASYSQNPESRMLIVNGQIYREGDQLAPNVSLEQIRLKEAVIATKGYRYRIDY